MIKSLTKSALLPVAMAIGLPWALSAQTPAQPELTREQQEIEGLFTELQEVSQQLAPIQSEARQDPELSATEQQLSAELRVAMEAVDPTMSQRMERVQQLETEAIVAQREGDAQRLQALAGEAQEIQQHFLMVQESALQEPSMATKVTTYQAQLEGKMIEVDPAAADLLIRFRELEKEIEAAMGAGV